MTMIFANRASLMKHPDWTDIPTDTEGNPCVWSNTYACACGEQWESNWSCQCDDRCPSCGTSVQTEGYAWAGPSTFNSYPDAMASALAWRLIWRLLPEAGDISTILTDGHHAALALELADHNLTNQKAPGWGNPTDADKIAFIDLLFESIVNAVGFEKARALFFPTTNTAISNPAQNSAPDQPDIPKPENPDGPIPATYTLAVTLLTTVSVQALSGEEARKLVQDVFDGAEANFGAWPDGSPVLAPVEVEGTIYVNEIDRIGCERCGNDATERFNGETLCQDCVIAVAENGALYIAGDQ